MRKTLDNFFFTLFIVSCQMKIWFAKADWDIVLNLLNACISSTDILHMQYNVFIVLSVLFKVKTFVKVISILKEKIHLWLHDRHSFHDSFNWA